MTTVNKIVSQLIDSWDVHEYVSFETVEKIVNIKEYIAGCDFEQNCIFIIPSWREGVSEDVKTLIDIINVYTSIVFWSDDGIYITGIYSKEIMFTSSWNMINNLSVYNKN